MNINKFTFIDLFAGIGGIRLGVEANDGRCVFTSEWDQYAQKTYYANFGEKPHGDITQISTDDIPDHDLLTAGFPCQPFSIMGDGLGFSDTRGTLFFDIERIIRDKQPHMLLLENVKRLKSHDKGRTLAVIKKILTDLGYHLHIKVLNALDFGLPQKRERIFIIGFKKNYDFRFPSHSLLTRQLTLEDILEDDDTLDDKWFASDYITEKRKQSVEHKTVFYPSVWHENKGGNISVLPFSCALRAGASFNYLLVNGKRRLTSREQLRLQGFPDDFIVCGPETQIRKQTGNSVAVPVIVAIVAQMKKAIAKGEIPEHERLATNQLPLFDGAFDE